MNENPIIDIFFDFGDKMGEINGSLFHVNSHLTKYCKILKDKFSSEQDNYLRFPLISTTIIMGDLTGKHDNGWKINFPTGFSTKLHVEDIDIHFEKLIHIQCMREIAFSYEILESYLYDITACFLFVNKSKYCDIIKKYKLEAENLSSLQNAIRKLRRKNNKDLFKLIRSINPTFDQAETNNLEEINLKEWYQVLSFIRHGIIHSDFTIKKGKNNITDNHLKILKRFITFKETDDGYHLKLTNKQADKLVTFITEYGFLVFKSFSTEGGYEWKIFRNMEGPPKINLNDFLND